MASGSQTCSGNCADLPTVPMMRKIPMMLAALTVQPPKMIGVVVASRSSASGLYIISRKLSVPVML